MILSKTSYKLVLTRRRKVLEGVCHRQVGKEKTRIFKNTLGLGPVSPGSLPVLTLLMFMPFWVLLQPLPAVTGGAIHPVQEVIKH